jgi:hypothetical protein
MMLAYHFGMRPTFGPHPRKAKQHDVGIVAMKTLKGGRHADLATFRDDAMAALPGRLPLGAVEPERLVSRDLDVDPGTGGRVPAASGTTLARRTSRS